MKSLIGGIAAVLAAVAVAGGSVGCSQSSNKEPQSSSYRAGYQGGSYVISHATVGPAPTDGEIREMCGQQADTAVETGLREFQLAPGEVNRQEYVKGCVAGMSG